MKTKFNWGHGIALFYIVFVGIVITALVASFDVDHSLVVDNYYAQDLAYQATYEKIENSLQSDNVSIKQDANQILLSFSGKEALSGTVQFYRASDKSMDFTHTIVSNNERIPIKDLAAGKWRLKIDWKEGQKQFYKEKILYL